MVKVLRIYKLTRRFLKQISKLTMYKLYKYSIYIFDSDLVWLTSSINDYQRLKIRVVCRIYFCIPFKPFLTKVIVYSKSRCEMFVLKLSGIQQYFLSQLEIYSKRRNNFMSKSNYNKIKLCGGWGQHFLVLNRFQRYNFIFQVF